MADTNHSPSRDPFSRPGRRPYWLLLERFSWLRSSWCGYLASALLIGGLLALEKLDEYLLQAPIFIGAPFVLTAILVALIWGLGPALVSIVLGFLTLIFFISTDAFTPNLLKDLQLDGPFLLVQFALWLWWCTHSWLNRSRRLLVRWEKKTDNYLAFPHLACAQLLFAKAFG